jgi:hypothetical protein
LSTEETLCFALARKPKNGQEVCNETSEIFPVEEHKFPTDTTWRTLPPGCVWIGLVSFACRGIIAENPYLLHMVTSQANASAIKVCVWEIAKTVIKIPRSNRRNVMITKTNRIEELQLVANMVNVGAINRVIGG